MGYSIGYILGYFVAGCILGGMFPLIVSFIKKRIPLGLAAVIGCGLLGFISSWVSAAVGILAGIALCIVPKKNS